MWELDHKESWAPKNWCFWTVVFEKTLESPLDCKEIKLVNPKGNQSWILIGRADAEAKALILCPPDAKNWLIRKHPDAGNVWRTEEKGTTEDETVGWHHQFNGCEFEQTPGVGNGQWSLACCSPWGCKEPDTTEQLNWTDHKELPVGPVVATRCFYCRSPGSIPGWETKIPQPMGHSQNILKIKKKKPLSTVATVETVSDYFGGAPKSL